MKIISSRKKHLLILFTVLVHSMYSQQSDAFVNENADYNNALRLYNNKSYAAAQEVFIKVRKTTKKNSTINSDASYFDAMCAVKLNQKDADKKVINFVAENPVSNKKNKAFLNVANFYFANKKTAYALKWYQKVNTDLISEENKKELNFKMGFSLLTANKLALARKKFFPLINDSKYGNDARYYYGFIAYKLEDYGVAESTLKEISDNKSYKAEIAYYLLDISFKSGNFEKCINVGKEILPSSKRKVASEISKIIGESYFNLEQYSESIPYLLGYKGKMGKWNNTDYYQVGYAYYKRNDFDNAIQYFNKIIGKKNTVSQNAYYHLAECYLNIDKKNEALNAFKAASEMNFNPQIKEDAALNYAKISYETGNPYENVSDVLQNYLKKYPNSKSFNEINELIVSSFINNKNYEGALNYLKSKNTKENLAFTYEVSLYRGIQLYNEKKLDLALPYFNKSKKSKDFSISNKGQYWEAETLFLLEEYEKSLFEFKDLKKDIQDNSFPLIDYNIGYANFKLKQYSDATNSFKEFLSKSYTDDEINYDAYLRLGDCYYANRKYEQSINAFNSVIKNEALQADYAQYQIGMCYGFLEDDNSKIKALTSVLDNYEVSNLKDDALYQLATTFTKIKENKKAHQAYDRLTKKYTNSNFVPKALVRQGLLYYNENKNSKALEKFKWVASKYPNSEDAFQAVRSAKNIYVDEDRLDDYVKWTKSLKFIEVSDNELENSSFAIAEKKYFEEKRPVAIAALKKYLKKFPKGKNNLKANYYLADVLFKEQLFDDALKTYELVLKSGVTEYNEEALTKIAQIYLEKQNYKKATPILSQLEKVANTTENIQFAQSNLMKCYNKTNEYNLAINYAKKVLSLEKLNEGLELDAKTTIARTSIINKDFSTAKEYFENIESFATGELKAESLYYNAFFKHKEKEYEASNEAIQKLIADYAKYKYWGVKSYIIMGKNYYQLKDVYQATFILENVIKNFSQFEDLVKEAQRELNDIKNNEAKTNNSVTPKN